MLFVMHVRHFFEHFEIKTYRNLIKVELRLCSKNVFAPLS